MNGVATAPLQGIGRPTAVDAALALLFAAVAQLEVWAGGMPGPAGAKMLLALAIGTAKTDVARILMKLDLRDRVQAVVLAYETGLAQPRPGAG